MLLAVSALLTRLHLAFFCLQWQQHSVIPARWSSSDSQGGNGGKGEGRHESSDGGKQGGFLRNFIANLQRGLEQNKDMQESLRGFHEERTKMEQSYVLQTARQKMTDAKVRGMLSLAIHTVITTEFLLLHRCSPNPFQREGRV